MLATTVRRFRPLLLLLLLLTPVSLIHALTLNSVTAGGSTTFNALLLEASGSPKTGIVLLHGRASHADGPVVAELRTSLHQAGYTTLSIDTPSPIGGPYDFNNYINDIASGTNFVFPETYARIITAVDHLASLGIEKVFIVGFSMGSRLAAAHVARGRSSALPVIGLVGIGMYATAGVDPLDMRFTLDEIQVPLLDIHGDQDSNAVATAALRRSVYYSGYGPAFSHITLPCARELTVNDCHKLVGLKGNPSAPLEATVYAWMTAVEAALATSQPYLDKAETLSGGATDAVFLGGASHDGGATFVSHFASSDSIDVLASIGLDASDLGDQGMIFIVADYNGQFFYKDGAGRFKTWDGKLDSLEPADGPRPLAALESVEIIRGLNGLSGNFKIYIAYQDTDNNIHVTGTPISFQVAP